MALKIGIQGIPGAFCQAAGIEFCEKNALKPYEFTYLVSAEKVLRAIENKEVDYGILAVENAQGGVVIETIKALAEHQCSFGELFHLKINQNLLVQKGTSKEAICTIHSHPQALKQCKDYLKKHFSQQKLVESADTAVSAKMLSEGNLPENSAVIGAKICVELYELELLEESIQDLKENLTLFLSIKPYKK